MQEALAAQRDDLESVKRERAGAQAVPMIAMNPSIVDANRGRMRRLAVTLNAETARPTKCRSGFGT